MTEIKRLTATKTSIKPLINGRFVKQEGFDPSFVISPSGQRLSRVRILATVVNKYEPEGGKFSSVTIDDGTATIRAKIFGSSLFSGIKEADLVDVIGKIREYNGEIYVLSESVVKLDDPNWEILRELELRKQAEKWNMIKSRIFDLQKEASDILELKKLAQAEGMDPEDIEPVLLSQDIAEVQPSDTSNEAKKKILDLIEKLDDSKGADYMAVAEASDLSEDVLDAIINELLNDGLCFEPRPGKIKKL